MRGTVWYGERAEISRGGNCVQVGCILLHPPPRAQCERNVGMSTFENQLNPVLLCSLRSLSVTRLSVNVGRHENLTLLLSWNREGKSSSAPSPASEI